MSIRPLNDRVLVARMNSPKKTVGGIIIPDSAKEKPQEGEVVATGPGNHDHMGKVVPMTIKAGDRVFFSPYAGTEIKVNGIEHLFIKEADILAVIES